MGSFGIGYKITVEVKTKEEQKDLIDNLHKTVGIDQASVDDSTYSETKKLNITISLDQKTKMADILSYLDSKELTYVLKSNNLEQAFLDFTKEDQNSLDKYLLDKQELFKLFDVKYNSTGNRIYLALVYKGLCTHYSSWISKIMLAYMIIVPLFLGQLFYKFYESADTKKYIDIKESIVPSLAVLLNYLMMGSFIAYQPFFERASKLRFHLKLDGINSTRYYLSMLTSDSIYILINLVVVNFVKLGFVFVKEKEKIDNFDWGYFRIYQIKIFLMILKFICCSYAVQKFASNSSTIKSLPIFIAFFDAAL